MKGFKLSIRAGQGKNKMIKRPGQPKKVMSPGVPEGGGMGQNNLTGASLK